MPLGNFCLQARLETGIPKKGLPMAMTPRPTNTPGHPETSRSHGDTDAPHMSPITPSEDARSVLINRVSWGAILVGVVVGLVVQLLLTMFGIGIGAATLDPGTGDNPSAQGFSITAAIWWAVSGIIAALIGGFAAGRLSGAPKESTAAWHALRRSRARRGRQACGWPSPP